MAESRPSISPASGLPASAEAGGELPAAPQRPAKADPNEPLKNVRAGEDDSTPWQENSYHPRFGDDWLYYVNLVYCDYHNMQSGKDALKIGKARNALVKSILVGGVGRPRVDPTFFQTQMDPDLAPDVAETEFKSKSLAAEWDGHYGRMAAQAAKGASSTYSA